MRQTAIILAALLAVVGAVTASQDPIDDPATAGSASPRLLSVELTRLVVEDVEENIAAQLSDAEDLRRQISRLEQSGKIRVHERIGLTALEHEKSTVRFGRRVPLVVGETVAARGVRTQRTQYTELGTILQVMSRSEGEDVFLELMYESSHHEPQQDDNRPPTLVTMSVNTTLRMALGESVLVSAAKSDDHSLLVVTCEPSGRRTQGRRGRGGAPATGADGRGTVRRSTAAEASADRFTDYARGLIQRYDNNDDGIIEREEARESPFGRRFDDYDVNRDGKVTPAEVVERIKAKPARDR